MSTTTLPGTGAKATVVTGKYKDNAKNRKLNRVGQSYTAYRFVTDPARQGKPITVNGAPISRARRTISAAQAQRAFNAYWNARKRAATSPASRAGIARAQGKDVAYSYKDPRRTTSTTRYNKFSAGRLDFAGVDAGAKRFKGPSAAHMEKLKKLAAARLDAAVAAGTKKRRSLAQRREFVENLTGMGFAGQQGGRYRF